MHRDFKPDNFLLTDSLDASASLKVADFGHSVLVAPGTSLADIVGSLPYHAPEVQQGRYAYSADLWSLGVTLYNMLSGLMPSFDGNAGKMLSRLHLSLTAYMTSTFHLKAHIMAHVVHQLHLASMHIPCCCIAQMP